MMLALYAPVMLMLAFYLYMAANLIIERQKTEISVFRSRGASRLQIMFVYTIESLILGLSALAVGPFIGVAFTKILGASSGFLEFVQRAALEVSLNSDAYKMGIAAVSAAIILIPDFGIPGHTGSMLPTSNRWQGTTSCLSGTRWAWILSLLDLQCICCITLTSVRKT